MPSGSSKEELMSMTVAEIMSQLIRAHENGQDINLNKWETDLS